MSTKNETKTETKTETNSTSKLALADLQKFQLAPGEKFNWDDVGGETYGGGSNYLQMKVGEVAGPFAYLRTDEGVKLTDDSKEIDIPVALTAEGKELRMPASAVFRINFEEAEANPGEVFFVSRLPDTEKKTGSKAQGKGRMMEVYAIKFPNRK
jgi:hypothetical protein